MLFLLSSNLFTQFGMIEAVIGGMRDMFPWCRVHRVKFIALLCLVQLLLAIPMITQSGIYWVTLIDWYASGIPLMFAAACEIICISWVYGVNRFLYDIKCMIGYKPKGSFWWILTWKFITPACIIILIFSSFFYYTPVKYNGISYPKWGEVIGWMSACISIVCIPGVALYKMYTHPRAHGNFLEVRSMFKKNKNSLSENFLSSVLRSSLNVIKIGVQKIKMFSTNTTLNNKSCYQ